MASNDTALKIFSDSLNPKDKFDTYLLSVTLNWATVIVGTPLSYDLTGETFVVVVIAVTMVTGAMIFIILSTTISVIKIFIFKLLQRRKMRRDIENLRAGDDDILSRLGKAMLGDDIKRLIESCIEPDKVYEIIFKELCVMILRPLKSRNSRRLLMSRAGLLALNIAIKSGGELEFSLATNVMNLKGLGTVITARLSNQSVLIALALKGIGLGIGGLGLVGLAIRIFKLSFYSGLGATALAAVMVSQVGLVTLANERRIVQYVPFKGPECQKYVKELPKIGDFYLMNDLDKSDKNDLSVYMSWDKNANIREAVQTEPMESNQEDSDNILNGPIKIRKRDYFRRLVKGTKNKFFGFFNFKKKVNGIAIDGVIYETVPTSGQNKILDRPGDFNMKSDSMADFFKQLDESYEAILEGERKAFFTESKVTTEQFTRATNNESKARTAIEEIANIKEGKATKARKTEATKAGKTEATKAQKTEGSQGIQSRPPKKSMSSPTKFNLPKP